MTKQKGIMIGRNILFGSLIAVLSFYGGLHFRHEDRIDALMIKAAESVIRQENTLDEMRRSRIPMPGAQPLVLIPKEA